MLTGNHRFCMRQPEENVFDEAYICASLEVSHTFSQNCDKNAPYLSLLREKKIKCVITIKIFSTKSILLLSLKISFFFSVLFFSSHSSINVICTLTLHSMHKFFKDFFSESIFSWRTTLI